MENENRIYLIRRGKKNKRWIWQSEQHGQSGQQFISKISARQDFENFARLNKIDNYKFYQKAEL